MKIAYLISAHKDPIHLERLINALRIKNTTHFFIHIDKKVDKGVFANILKGSDITFCKERVYTTWGGSSQCLYQINLIKELINTDVRYDRVFFISGQDYPLISNNKLIEILNSTQTEFIQGINISNPGDKSQLKRIRNYHFFRNYKGKDLIRRILVKFSRDTMAILPLRKKKLKINNQYWDIYFGSSWWCLTWECLNMIYSNLRDGKIFNYFKYAYGPDELMIQTIVFNSYLKQYAIKGEIMDLPDLTPIHYIDYKGSIKVFSKEDYDTLIKTDKWFFRKAETGKSDELLDMIDEYRAKN